MGSLAKTLNYSERSVTMLRRINHVRPSRLPMSQRRRVYFVSDRTGITVEALGSSLLTQFGAIDFLRVTLPFIDSIPKAIQVVAQVNAAHKDIGQRPLVFSSIVDDAVRAEINKCDGLVLDVFERFIVPLESELGTKSSHQVGKSHSGNAKDYNHRIEDRKSTRLNSSH